MRSSFLQHPLLKIAHGALISLPSPRSLSGWWTFGSLLGLCLLTQVLTGLFLAFQYSPSMSNSFDLVLSLPQTVNTGWGLRVLHANGASLFFICLYLHVSRGLYYGSYRLTSTWLIGCLILLLVMGAAFLGYVLPWGQMSFWGATVITSLITAIPQIGDSILLWLWGGYAVGDPTLSRFYAFHFLVPLVVGAFAAIHLFFLHSSGSSSPGSQSQPKLKINLGSHFLIKDSLGFILFYSSLLIISMQWPWALGDPENFIFANPMVAPVHIQPEWYFLFAYAILRSIPNKLGGVLALVCSVLILGLVSALKKPHVASSRFYFMMKLNLWTLLGLVGLLTWIGACPVEAPYIFIGQILSISYFGLFYSLPKMGQLTDIIVGKPFSNA